MRGRADHHSGKLRVFPPAIGKLTTYNDGEWLRSTAQAYEADASMTVTGLSGVRIRSAHLSRLKRKPREPLRIRYKSAIDWENIGGELSFYLNSGYVFGSSDPTTDWETFELALSANQTYTFEIQYYHYSGRLFPPSNRSGSTIFSSRVRASNATTATTAPWIYGTATPARPAPWRTKRSATTATPARKVPGPVFPGNVRLRLFADQTPCADDENPCTNDVCLSGTCEHDNLDNGVSCDSDGEDCIIETCQEGTCTAEKLDRLQHLRCRWILCRRTLRRLSGPFIRGFRVGVFARWRSLRWPWNLEHRRRVGMDGRRAHEPGIRRVRCGQWRHRLQPAVMVEARHRSVHRFHHFVLRCGLHQLLESLPLFLHRWQLL